MRRRLAFATIAALLTAVTMIAAGKTLDIYFIDVEGGQATLLVTPDGESLLIDAGYAGFGGRDPGRIVAAAKAAGLSRIDYLLVTHFHSDHVGGVPELSRQLPITTFIDHDTVLPTDTMSVPVFEPYAAVRATRKHIVAKPGERVPLKGLDIEVVSSGGDTIKKPVSGAGQLNAACESQARAAAEPIENPRSTGVLLRLGKFTFVDLGDLSGNPLFALFCPNNLLGHADVLLVPHHGGSDVVYPATLDVKARVAIVNNGEKKGGAGDALAALQRAKPPMDVWQLHRSADAGAANTKPARIANLDESTGHWIKVSASEDGAFSVTNARTGETTRYAAK